MSKQIDGLILIAVAMMFWTVQANARPDIDEGKREFNRSCRGCHSLTSGEVKEGPSLAGVFGRRAGSLPEYNYSPAMQESKVIWTQDSLDTYLASPLTTMGSGIDMMSHGIRNEEARADLIEFLKHAL